MHLHDAALGSFPVALGCYLGGAVVVLHCAPLL